MEDKSIMSMIITVLISVIIIGAVLIPILGQVSDNGGSGDSEKIMLNTFESSIGDDLTPYKSYQIYHSDTTPTLPNEITYTLEDLTEMLSILESHSDEIAITIVEAYDESYSGVNISFSGGEMNITIMNNGSGTGNYILDITSLNLTISTDYSLDCSYTYEYPAGSDPRTESIQITVTEVTQLSDSEDGWMAISNDFHDDKISVGSKMMLSEYIGSLNKEWYKTILITEDMISDNHLQFTIDWEDGYTSDIDFELQSTDMDGVWKFTDDFYNWYGTIKDSDGVEMDTEESYCYVAYLSTYGYTQSESGSGSGGMSNILMGIIPVFILLGILIYAVQYLRPDNKL